MTEELKLCPFCGGKPFVFRSPYLDEDCNIECSVCGAMSKSFNRHDDPLLEDFSEFYAREAWNRRVQP